MQRNNYSYVPRPEYDATFLDTVSSIIGLRYKSARMKIFRTTKALAGPDI